MLKVEKWQHVSETCVQNPQTVFQGQNSYGGVSEWLKVTDSKSTRNPTSRDRAKVSGSVGITKFLKGAESGKIVACVRNMCPKSAEGF